MDLITQLITQFTAWINAITGNNHFMAAAVLTGIAFICRSIPSKIYDLINRQLFYVVNLTDSYDTNGATNTVKALFKWHQQSRWAKFSRNAQLRDSGDSLEDRILTGVGRHFFMHKGVIFWMGITLHEPKSGSQGEVNRVVIRTFIWNRAAIKDILLDIYPVNFDRPAIYNISSGGGHYGPDAQEIGRVDSLYGNQKQMIDIDQYNEMDKTIDRFMNNKQWYIDNEVKYKETFLLYGEPGTGKSTLVRHFASRYNIPIIVTNPSQLTALRAWLIQRNGMRVVVLLEDIDNTEMLCTWGNDEEDETNDSVPAGKRLNTIGYVRSMKSERSYYLNFFDGVAPLENVLVFKTTNHIEKLHSSVYRPGRIDHLFNITYPTHHKIANILGWDYNDERMEVIRQYDLKDFPLAILANLKRAKDINEVKRLLHKGNEFFQLEAISGVKYFKIKDETIEERIHEL